MTGNGGEMESKALARLKQGQLARTDRERRQRVSDSESVTEWPAAHSSLWLELVLSVQLPQQLAARTPQRLSLGLPLPQHSWPEGRRD